MIAAASPALARCFLISKSIHRPRIDPNDPPSIVRQTEFLCDYFNFSKSALPVRIGTDYFNCGFVARDDGDWLLVRRSRAVQGMPFGMNDIVAFKLIDGTIPTQANVLTIRNFYGNEHFEDPRVIYHEGKTFVSCTNFIWAPRNSGAHQIICEFDNDWRLIKRYDPIYGGNGPHCFANKRQEKNWLYFFHNGLPHLLYSADPHDIAQLTCDFKPVIRYETKPNLRWTWGQIRGGTPPFLVGDEYWTFFHSSVDWAHGGVRRYHVGAYAFDCKPPFKITRYTPQPLLSGSREDVWSQGKPYVCFPNGAILRHGEWFVTLGVNDIASAYWCPTFEGVAEKTMRI